jgi:hypothetical protein
VPAGRLRELFVKTAKHWKINNLSEFTQTVYHGSRWNHRVPHQKSTCPFKMAALGNRWWSLMTVLPYIMFCWVRCLVHLNNYARLLYFLNLRTILTDACMHIF